jgi:hypothetical protein
MFVIGFPACKMNIHKRCEKNVAKNCGLNTQKLAEAMRELGLVGRQPAKPKVRELMLLNEYKEDRI